MLTYLAAYAIALVLFFALDGIWPALRAGSPLPALFYGALFGLLAYATYDLTNHATLKNWTLKITAIDIV